MKNRDEECIDLRNSWRTFMVPKNTTAGELVNNRHDGEYTLLYRYRVVGTDADDQPLFFLSFIGPNCDLLCTTAHLFVQLNSQYRQCVADCEEKVIRLRDQHEQHLADLLEVANRDTKDMVVGSDITWQFVHKHQRELEELLQQNRQFEIAVEMDLRKSLLAFLKTSAPDALSALSKENGRGNSRGDNERVSRVTDIGHFASPPVPVKTVELPNILNHAIGNLRSKNLSLRPIVVDVSPFSFLQSCLNCLYMDGCDTTPAVEEHLFRLSQQRHAVLLFIGSQAEAELILSIPAAELLLQDPLRFRKSRGFVPLRHHRHLRFMLTTRFWGANIILLWTPPKEDSPLSSWPYVVEDALNLAFAWNADMFSVAVLKSAGLSECTSSQKFLQREQDISVAVLRQLQHGMAWLAYESAGVKLSTTWDLSEEPELQAFQRPRLRRWEDGYTSVFPEAAGMPKVTFNTDIAIRVFLPDSIFLTEGMEYSPTQNSGFVIASGSQAEGDNTDRRGGRRDHLSTSILSDDSFSSDVVKFHKINSHLQLPMSFKRLLVYTFGETAVVH